MSRCAPSMASRTGEAWRANFSIGLPNFTDRHSVDSLCLYNSGCYRADKCREHDSLISTCDVTVACRLAMANVRVRIPPGALQRSMVFPLRIFAPP